MESKQENIQKIRFESKNTNLEGFFEGGLNLYLERQDFIKNEFGLYVYSLTEVETQFMLLHWLRNRLKNEDYTAIIFVEELKEYTKSIQAGVKAFVWWDYSVNKSFLLFDTFTDQIIKIELIDGLLTVNFESKEFDDKMKDISFRKEEVFRMLHFYIFNNPSEREIRVHYFLDNTLSLIKT